MSTFTREDVNALFSLVPLVFWQLYNPPVNTNYGHAYEFERHKHNVRGALPAWIFPIAWAIVYALIISSGFIFFREYQDNGTFYMATTVIYLVNIMLNKYWSVVFFRGTINSKRYALLILIVLMLTGLVVVLLQFIVGALLPALLYTGYLLWLVYVFVINIKWLSIPVHIPGKAPTIRKYKSRHPPTSVVKKHQTTLTTTRTITTGNLPRFITKK